MEMLFLIVVNYIDLSFLLFGLLRMQACTVTFLSLSINQANNVSIVVCSSFLTSSNMSKNFSIPRNLAIPYFVGPFVTGPGEAWRITESNR